MNKAQQILKDCNGFIKGAAYEALKQKALSKCDYDDQADDETLTAVFSDGSRLVFWGNEEVTAD